MLLSFHYASDYLLQSRTDAINKSSSLYHLTRHVGIYTLAMTIYTVLFFKYGLTAGLFTFSFLFVFHWIIDYFTSRMSAKAYTSGKNKAFWSILGADQLLHQLHLITYLYLLWKIK